MTADAGPDTPPDAGADPASNAGPATGTPPTTRPAPRPVPVSGPFAEPFEAYIAPARRKAAIWRILVGLVLIGLCFFGWQIVLGLGAALVVAVGAMQESGGMGGLQEAMRAVESFLLSVSQLTTPTRVLFALALFGGAWGGVALAVWAMHGRGLRTVLAAPGRSFLRDLGRGAGFALLIVGGLTLVTLPLSDMPARSDISVGEWLIYLLPLLPLLLVQIGAEELLFRGYLLQQLAARFRNPLIWGALPSVLFGAMHWWNVDGALTSALYVGVTALFGIAAAIMVYQSGGLGCACGFHLVFNLNGLALFGMEDTHDGLSLFVVPKGDFDSGLGIDLALMAALVLLLLSPWSPFRVRQSHPPRGAGTDGLY